MNKITGKKAARMPRRGILIPLLFLALLCLPLLTAGARGENLFPGQSAQSSGGLTNEQAAEGYISQMMPSKNGTATSPKRNSVTTGTFSEFNKRFYALAKEQIQKVARGELSDTRLKIPYASLYTKTRFTAADLGVPAITDSAGKLLNDALDAFLAAIRPDLGSTHKALLLDCPYDLYWYDKTAGCGYDMPGLEYEYDSNAIRLIFASDGYMILRMRVAKEYSLENTTGTYTLNTTFGRSVTAAAARVKSIVAQYSALGDIDKLYAYKEEICTLVDYNYPAVEDDSTPYGNPWQLIWIFDGNPETLVVCEGYAKGFQYLCDLSSFRGAVSCRSVWGLMSVVGGGSGGHMWNLVTLSGKNYLADLTNCDRGSIGYPDRLFLAGYDSCEPDGSGHYRYYYTFGGYSVCYEYDSQMAALFGKNELELELLGPDTGSFTRGSCGNGVSWVMNKDGTLLITGSGRITADGTLWDQNSLRVVYISKGITGIGAGAFTACPNLKEIHFPDSGLAQIDEGAFDPPAAGDSRIFYIPCTLSSAASWAGANGYKADIAHTAAVRYDYVEPTCTEAGGRNRTVCSACGYFHEDESIPALGHSPAADAAKAATCDLSGLTEGSHCSRCGTVLKAQETVPALGHVPVTDAAKAVSCEESGLTEGSHCSRCGTVLKAQETVPALGHNWDNGTVTREATYEEKGIRCFTCGRCGRTREEEIPWLVYLGKTGWIHNADGSWSYGDADGNAAIGPSVIGGVMYCFNEQGYMITGWGKLGSHWFCADSSGAVCHGGWYLLDGVWYYFRANGEMATGWVTDGGCRYYMQDSGALATGWERIGKDWYYFGSSGAMRTGWLLEGDTWYLLQSGGAMASGWAQSGGKWYYFSGSGAMLTGWLSKGGQWYYLGDDGALATGWFRDTAAEKYRPGTEMWYWADSSGAIATGWQIVGGKWEYFDSSGLWQYTWSGN